MSQKMTQNMFKKMTKNDPKWAFWRCEIAKKKSKNFASEKY